MSRMLHRPLLLRSVEFRRGSYSTSTARAPSRACCLVSAMTAATASPMTCTLCSHKTGWSSLSRFVPRISPGCEYCRHPGAFPPLRYLWTLSGHARKCSAPPVPIRLPLVCPRRKGLARSQQESIRTWQRNPYRAGIRAGMDIGRAGFPSRKLPASFTASMIFL